MNFSKLDEIYSWSFRYMTSELISSDDVIFKHITKLYEVDDLVWKGGDVLYLWESHQDEYYFIWERF
ncbi:MAG: hypothetical protein ACJ0RA_03535 [Candidatus Neomarinimicrobiota bacterium]